MFSIRKTTVSSITAAFAKTVQRLEALAEKQLAAADAKRARASEALAKAQDQARSLRGEADVLVDEAREAVRVSSRIQALLK